MEGFEKRIGEIEERRQEVLEAVLRQQDDTDWLEGDVLEAEEEERKREQEWIIEREIGELPAARAGDALDAAAARRTTGSASRSATALAITLLFALVIPLDRDADLRARPRAAVECRTASCA